MFPLILRDIAGPGVVEQLGDNLLLGVVWFVAVVALEGWVLSLTRWAPFRRALLPAFVMNAVTTLIGLFATADNLDLNVTAWFFLAFLGSVLVEWGVLVLLDRQRARAAFTASLAANLASYVVTGLLLAALALFF